MAATVTQGQYTAKTWNYTQLNGISEKTLSVHFGLYQGYVKNTNALNEQIADHIQKGTASPTNLAFAELTRRLGFEYNGMRLHEYYFDNLTPNSAGEPKSGRLTEALARTYGDFESWKKDFIAVGGLRGVGWAIAYQDPFTGEISNHWVTLHQDGNVAGFEPILVMDVWEHAFMLDYKPAERGKYIEAFFSNVDWNAVEARLRTPRQGR